MVILGRSDLKIKHAIPYFESPEMADLGWLRHGFLMRGGGVSPPPYDSLNLGFSGGDLRDRVLQNRDRIARAFGFDPNRLVLLNQVHGDNILVLRKNPDPPPSPLPYDALISDIPNLFLGIRTADCFPIFVVDPKKKVLAAIHAGRQGTALGMTSKVLRAMKEEFKCDPNDLLVAIGPGIGPCCYEIGEEVFHAEWEIFATSSGKGKWKIDLSGINRAQMEKEGITSGQIQWVHLCTRCHPDLFFSHRRGARTGRQLSFIGRV